MNVALPEVDGRVLTPRGRVQDARERFDPRTESRSSSASRRSPTGSRFVAELAAAWARLRRTPAAERRVAHRARQLPEPRRPARQRRRPRHAGEPRRAAAARCGAAGYGVDGPAGRRPELIEALLAGVTNELAGRAGRAIRRRACRSPTTAASSQRLPDEVRATRRRSAGARRTTIRTSRTARFALAVLPLGNVVVGIQPARGYHIDPSATYHDPDLPPPHGYLAFYAWLRQSFGAHAIVHSASTATSNGCPARRWRSPPTACPRRCSGRCRTSTRSSSTTPARARRPSGGRPR